MGPGSCGALGVSRGGRVPGGAVGAAGGARPCCAGTDSCPAPGRRTGPRGYGVALSAGAECPWRGVRWSAAPGTVRGSLCPPAARRLSWRMRGGGRGGGKRAVPALSSPQRRGAAALLLPAQRYGDGGQRTHGVPVTGEGGLQSGVLRTGSAPALGGLPETDVPGTLPRTPPGKWRGGREEAASRLPGLPCSTRGLSAGLK